MKELLHYNGMTITSARGQCSLQEGAVGQT